MRHIEIKPKKLINLESCLRCQERCCRFKKGDEDWSPLFSQAEVEKINKLKIKTDWKKFGGSYRTNLVASKKKNKELLCPFLDDEKFLCRIEKFKPLDCILWPFVFMKNQEGTAINLTYYDSKYCAGLKDIGAKEFNSYKTYLIEWCKTLDNKKISDISWDFDSDAEFVEELLKYPSVATG